MPRRLEPGGEMQVARVVRCTSLWERSNLQSPRNYALRGKSWSCTFCRSVRPGFSGTASSSQVTRRHPKVTTYRCCLPALAGFAGFCRVGPSLHRHLNRTVPKRASLEKGFDPAVADCGSAARRRSQGTASSPSSTTKASLADMGYFVKGKWIAPVGRKMLFHRPLSTEKGAERAGFEPARLIAYTISNRAH